MLALGLGMEEQVKAINESAESGNKPGHREASGSFDGAGAMLRIHRAGPLGESDSNRFRQLKSVSARLMAIRSVARNSALSPPSKTGLVGRTFG